MKHKFKIKRITEFDLEGNLKFEQFKVKVEVATQGDHGVYEKYMSKTFDTYAEARSFIRKHEGI